LPLVRNMQRRRYSDSTNVVDPRLLVPWAAKAAGDRLSSTLFLAGLLHGVILLGVTFTGDSLSSEPTATSLEVVLITNEYERRSAPETADLLAQQNMSGAGNTDAPMMLKTALHQALETGQVGLEKIGAQDPQRQGTNQYTQRPTIVAKSAAGDMLIPENHAEERRITESQQKTLPGTWNAIEIVNKPEDETLISDFRPRELIISANTREARIAAYLGRWKNKIERVGTLNYPRVARSRDLVKFTTLEVAINANGELQDVVVRNSSGQKSLDQAAMNIVNIAAPFDPFPEFLRTEYDVLRFAYAWRFTEGYVSSSLKTVGVF